MTDRERACRPCAAAIVVLIAFWLHLPGCATSAGPTHLTLASDQYADAFDAAVEVARATGMAAAMRDRRGGVIETDPAIAGTIFEPWDRGNVTFEAALENTISYHRRRARFEFAPLVFDHGVRRDLAGSDLLASETPALDLTTFDGDLELRVWVFIERSHIPGVRKNPWTRRMTSRAQVIDPETDRPLSASWTPMARDEALERRLLAQIRQRLALAAAE